MKKIPTIFERDWDGDRSRVRAQIGETTYPRSHEVVRTYHEADNRVTDHASGAQIARSELESAKRFGYLIEARARTGATGKQSGRVRP